MAGAVIDENTKAEEAIVNSLDVDNNDVMTEDSTVGPSDVGPFEYTTIWTISDLPIEDSSEGEDELSTMVDPEESLEQEDTIINSEGQDSTTRPEDVIEIQTARKDNLNQGIATNEIDQEVIKNRDHVTTPQLEENEASEGDPTPSRDPVPEKHVMLPHQMKTLLHDDHNENHDENSSQKLGRVCFNKSLYSASYQNISLLSLRCICLKFEIF